jgi:DNA-binding GntR family transcriptional regulator
LDEKSDIVDKHQMTIEAIRRNDAAALGLAIQADIADAVHLLKQTLVDRSNEQSVRKERHDPE